MEGNAFPCGRVSTGTALVLTDPFCGDTPQRPVNPLGPGGSVWLDDAMVLQIMSRRSRASRHRQATGPWLYLALAAAGLAAALMLAAHPFKP